MNRRLFVTLTIGLVVMFFFWYTSKNCEEIREEKTTTKTTKTTVYVGRVRTIIGAVNNRRRELELEMKNLTLPKGKFLSDYVPELGGNPLRIIIMTGFRSGSTFIGELISSIPGNFFYYEPLYRFGNHLKFRDRSNSTAAFTELRNLLECNFKNLTEYIKTTKWFKNQLFFNKQLWVYCRKYKLQKYCYNAEFLSRFCGLYPFQTMKIVRMSLHLIEEYLADDK